MTARDWTSPEGRAELRWLLDGASSSPCRVRHQDAAVEAVIPLLDVLEAAERERDGLAAAHTDERDAERARTAAAGALAAKLREALAAVLAWGVEHDDPRLRYITVQVDRVAVAEAREVLALPADREDGCCAVCGATCGTVPRAPLPCGHPNASEVGDLDRPAAEGCGWCAAVADEARAEVGRRCVEAAQQAARSWREDYGDTGGTARVLAAVRDAAREKP